MTTRTPLQPWQVGDEWINTASGLCLRVEQSAASSGGAATAWVATYPPYSPEPPLHFHPRQTELFSLLAGMMRVTHGGRTRDFTVGQTLTISPGETHAMWNPHREPALVRWETTPALRTEQWMGMLLALAAAGRTNARGVPGFFRLAVLLREYRVEIRLAAPPLPVQALVLGLASAVARLGGIRADRL